MILNDKQITKLAESSELITPFCPEKVAVNVVSYGLSSYGYDLRLSRKKFKIFNDFPLAKHVQIDVKNFHSILLADCALEEDENGYYFLLPPKTAGLGVSLEKVKIPRNIKSKVLAKSTYRRAGLICDATPGESGWEGHFTLEFYNSTFSPIKLYAGEGIVQLEFHQGEPPLKDYRQRGGKYQDQPEQIVLPKVRK